GAIRLRRGREVAAVYVDRDAVTGDRHARRRDLLPGDSLRPLAGALLLTATQRDHLLVARNAVEWHGIVAAARRHANRRQGTHHRRTNKPVAPLAHRESGRYGSKMATATVAAFEGASLERARRPSRTSHGAVVLQCERVGAAAAPAPRRNPSSMLDV